MRPDPDAPASILIVEDDPAIASLLGKLFEENGFAAAVAGSGAEMDRRMREATFDLVVLDAMLPGEDGFSICRRLRAGGPVPVLMLTALGDDIDRILGLELGADDYLTKPFHSRELLARVKGLLRRAAYAGNAARPEAAMRFAGWRIEPQERQLYDADGTRISLTTSEFDILLAFCRNPGRVLTREALLAMTHGGSAGPIERSIDVHISRLRQKIEPDLREPQLIKTVRLGGYFFAPKVETIG